MQFYLKVLCRRLIAALIQVGQRELLEIGKTAAGKMKTHTLQKQMVTETKAIRDAEIAQEAEQ